MGTTAEKFNYAFETKDLLKTEINKINNVLDDNSTFRSYPQELFNGYLDILNNGTDTLWNNLEKVSASGEEATLENVETAPIKMVLNGNTSQDGTPTPDTPVEVKVVKGENVVSVQGKNWFDKDNQAKVQVNAEGTLRYGIIVNAPNKKVSISGKNWNGYIAYKSLTNGVYGQWVNINRDTTINVTDKLIIYSNGDTIKLDTYVDDLQIEINDTPTPYDPYSKTDYPINLGDIELCKINTYKDYFHKDSGKWYVHKEIGKVVLDGSESWIAFNTNFKRSSVSYANLGTTFKSQGSTYDKGFSNYFVNANTENKIGFNFGSSALYLRINNDFTTLAEFKNWLATNNTTIYGILATPTEEEITDETLIEQLEAIYKAKSVKDKTYITQTNDELPFILDVEAIKEYSVE